MILPGICIVISPLIALMKDQVEGLKKKGIPAVAIYSGMNRREIDIALDNCVYAGIKFLYVSPERIQTELFIERFRQMQVCLLAVDEAHCISQWGYDFRPPYLEIAGLRDLVPKGAGNCPYGHRYPYRAAGYYRKAPLPQRSAFSEEFCAAESFLFRLSGGK